ncbi:MAG: hypothetical protein O3C40_33955 [Planctomycetota bacterium]|nr:hypothetical protein [Planctomycetota bacterium]
MLHDSGYWSRNALRSYHPANRTFFRRKFERYSQESLERIELDERWRMNGLLIAAGKRRETMQTATIKRSTISPRAFVCLKLRKK